MKFALLLFGLTVLTGVIWLLDVLWLRKARLARARLPLHATPAASGQTSTAADRATFADSGKTADARQTAEAANAAELVKPADPWWVDWSKSFFPIILFVFLLRSFIVEPFKIPSGSMMPTLLIGDFILVNKFSYGVRLPILNTKVLDVGSPERGDVMVFRFPRNPELDYIKRVIGVPGDRIEYRDQHLYVNGREVPRQRVDDFLDDSRVQYVPRHIEQLETRRHQILVNDETVWHRSGYPAPEGCSYNAGLVCTVPPGHYFMMGDNRDNSEDSRIWGFVPEANIVGRAFFIWFHWGSNWQDIGHLGSFD